MVRDHQAIMKCKTDVVYYSILHMSCCPCGRIVLHKRIRPHWVRTHVGNAILWKDTAGQENSSLLELVDVEDQFEGGTELQTHVLHHHVTAQQQQGFSVNLLQTKRGKS